MAIALLAPQAKAQAPVPQPRENLRGVISSARLTPPLHSRVRALRFSPDGAHILLQDEFAIYVVNRNPPSIQFWIPAAYALPARFSADSLAIVVATPDMTIERWNVSDGKELESKTYGSGGSCVTAALSPDAQFYACLGEDSNLHVFRVPTGVEVFQGRVGDPLDEHSLAIVPLHRWLARSQPFGYLLSNSLPPPQDVMSVASSMQFSPDGRFLITRNRLGELVAVDLQQRTKVNLPRSIRRGTEHSSFVFIAPDRLVLVAPQKNDESAVLSFPSGAVIGKLNVAGTVRATSNSRFVIGLPEHAEQANVVDISSGRAVVQISKSGGDILGDQLVFRTDDGILVFARIGEDHPELEARLPITPLSVLRTAAVSPNLEAVALGVTGRGGVFRVATGQRIASLDELWGAWFATEQICYLQVPGTQRSDSTVKSLNVATAGTSNAWTFESETIKNENMLSGPVFLKHFVRRILVSPEQQRFGYELQALDTATGKLLWLRAFGGDAYRIGQQKEVPVAFTDPQGDRLVLGWPAQSDGARKAAEHSRIVDSTMKQNKISAHDSVFEVLDARTGKYVGAALVQSGAGPDSFDSAFSAGDWLVLARSGRSVIAVSLSTGGLVEQKDTFAPAISTGTGLLSLAGRGGRLILYDLTTANTRDEYQFPDDVAYSHFSADGKKLLVLTEQQMLYVLDVTSGGVPTNQP